ncbi:hypothetical protein [Natrinema halophilum]|uniref:Uncharacterized protein n=1 Tax=Natrinema halophilum TaxID=1699371 RepID=A0A7D5L3E8_9EURY|nr:hypothetical protein [Natrinema halophilum]QLG49405.1 hypothetical protein HYG82_11295 [Natrinema halophilum]
MLFVGSVTLVLLGIDVMEERVLLGQSVLIGLGGAFHIVAATETRLTDRLAWYRWTGAGDVLIGCSLPIGLSGSDSPIYVLLVGVGGLSLAGMGFDMLAFHGRYTRGERLDCDGG